ncbi:hypothetical protein L841_3189 [Mycobacterium sp. MAC_080597_8934]|nr:hypothetical protein L841_3189 [Mycobacterium sp. MAC_080597_8934]
MSVLSTVDVEPRVVCRVVNIRSAMTATATPIAVGMKSTGVASGRSNIAAPRVHHRP